MNRLAMVGWLAGAALAGVLHANAQPITTIYSFTHGPATPMAGLTLGPGGNFYGTTQGGGSNNDGILFDITTNGNLTTLVNFNGYGTGGSPAANLFLWSDGNLYGTTSLGGTNVSGNNAGGTVIKVTTNGTVTTLVNFNGANGGIPLSNLTPGPDGNFYGTTEFGGTYSDGTVFKMTTNGTLTTLVNFNETNGANPLAGLAAGPGGTFYGTTRYGGGTNGLGTVFALTTNGTFTSLISFGGTNGAWPYGGITVGPDGNLYGTTSFGGEPNGDLSDGSIFELTTNGALTTLVRLADFGGTNGSEPYAGLTLGPDGNFYGTTYAGGAHGSGTVFQVSTNGTLAMLARIPGITVQTIYNSQGYEYFTTNDFNTIAPVYNGIITTVHSFSAQTNFINADGTQPQATVTFGQDGLIYGTASSGGTNGYGTVFKVTTNGTFTTLTSFSGNNGDGPQAALTLGPNGSLYGTANTGGTLNYGTVFKITPGGTATTVVNFDRANDGANPQAGLILGPGGNFYGTAAGGGDGLLYISNNTYDAISDGTAFELTTNGVFTTLVDFNGTNGANPYGGLAVGLNGNLYGTTTYGGISNDGVIFMLQTNGTVTVLTNFISANGANPFASLTLGLDGNFYGTCEAGGDTNGDGTIFQVKTNGMLTTLVYFNSTNGANPNDGLLQGPDGNFYGTTFEGGAGNQGTAFKVTPGGVLTTLVNFSVTNGEFPVGGLALGPDEYYYGTTEIGGVSANAGTIFKLATNGTLTTLYSFAFSTLSPNGNYPFATLTLATNGNFIHFYGSTYNGGTGGGGTIFELNLITSFSMEENTTETFLPLTNETVWATGGTLGLVSAVATNGTANISGSGIVFTPTANFTGTASINYTVTDNAGGTNFSVITVNVTNAPVMNTVLYNVVDLGLTNGPICVNDKGEIVGSSVSAGGTKTNVGLYWTNSLSPFLILSQPAGATRTGANHINDYSQIAGELDAPTPGEGLYWSNSTSLVLNLGGSDGEAIGMNDSGEIVGSTNRTDDSRTPVYWTNIRSAPIKLQLLGGTNGTAISINASGSIAGESQTSGGAGLRHAAFWLSNASAPMDLGTLGGTNSEAINLNDAGNIVGAARTSDEILHAAYWTNYLTAPLMLADSGGVSNLAACVNAPGQIVGAAVISGVMHAVLWTNSTSPVFDLNNLISSTSGWTLLEADCLNDLGEIVGIGITNGQLHGFALIPLNQPTNADLSLSVSAPAFVNTASTSNLVCSLTVSNAGPSVATGVMISYQLPTNVTFVSATGGATPVNGLLLLNLGALVVGATNPAQIVVTLQYESGFFNGGEVTNTFQTFASQTDPDLANNSATVVTEYEIDNNTTTSTRTVETNLTANVDLNTTNYATELIAKLANGTVVYDQTFAVPFSNAALQTAVMTAATDLTNAGASSYTGPTGTSMMHSLLGNSSVTVTNPVATNTIPTPLVTVYDGPTNILVGTNQAYSYYLFPGVVDIDSLFTTVISNLVTTTDTALYTNSSVYMMTGLVTAAATDLSLSASAAPEPVTIGYDLTYSLTVSNAGPATATGVIISNQVPADVNFIGASGGATPASGILLMNLGSLAPGATNEVQVLVQTTVVGKLTNEFQVYGNPADPNLTNNSATVVSTVTNAPPSFGIPGTPYSWVNPGGSSIVVPYADEAGDVVSIAMHFAAIAGYFTNFTLAAPGDVVLLLDPTGGNSPTNWGAVMEFFNPGDPTGSDGLAATDYEGFLASNTTSNGFANFPLLTNVLYLAGSATNLATAVTNGDAATTTEFGPAGEVDPGQEAVVIFLVNTRTTCTITSPSAGQVVSNAVFTVTGTTMPSINYLGVSFPATNVYLQLNGGGWTNATTANGWSNWSAVVTLTPGNNTVQAYAMDTFFGTPSLTNSVTFDYVSNSTAAADLTITASGTPNPMGVDNDLTYSITVSNGTAFKPSVRSHALPSGTATDVIVSNQLPSDVLFVSATGGATPVNGLLLINLGALAEDTTTNAQIVVEPLGAGQLTNLFMVYADQSNIAPSNNTATVVTTVTNIPSDEDVSITAGAAPEPVGVGNNLVYSIIVSNDTTFRAAVKSNVPAPAATDVTVSNRIPAGVTFVSATGGATPTNGLLLINLGTLNVGATNGVQIVVQPTIAGKLTNVFGVFADQPDPVPSNNVATVVSTVTNPPPATVDVALSLISAPNPVEVGSPLTYSLTATNNSPTTATGVVVSNTLPASVSFVSALPSQGSATNKGSLVTYDVGSLPNGVAATLAIVVIPNTAGLLTNFARAYSTQTDSVPANNSATNLTTAVSVPITNLVVTVLSGITLDKQTGLFEQQVEVSNGGPNTPASVLLLVNGLTGGATLYNATGKTNGLPYVQSAGPLGVGSNIVFLLEYYVPSRVMPVNLRFTVEAGPPVSPPVITGTVMSISRTVDLPGGDILVEFAAIPGRIYAVQYSSDMQTWQTAIPVITAPANRVQWIDAGPPQTASSPATATARYYRVVLLP